MYENGLFAGRQHWRDSLIVRHWQRDHAQFKLHHACFHLEEVVCLVPGESGL